MSNFNSDVDFDKPSAPRPTAPQEEAVNVIGDVAKQLAIAKNDAKTYYEAYEGAEKLAGKLNREFERLSNIILERNEKAAPMPTSESLNSDLEYRRGR